MVLTSRLHHTNHQDEFDSLFDDDAFLDPELEQSLAQAEATYTASQAIQPATNSSFRLHTQPSRSAYRTGTFVPPAPKKQRLDHTSSNIGRATAAAAVPLSSLYREPDPDQVIIRDLRDEEFADKDDDQWWAANNALDQVEQDAIRMSQQIPSSQPHTSTNANVNANANANPARLSQDHVRESARKSFMATSNNPPGSRPNHLPPDRGSAGSDELAQLRAEVERLRHEKKAQDDMVDKLKQEAYRKSGEVAVVRQNLTKINQENSKLREREVVREQEHRAALDRIQKEQERKLQRLETETAFRRVEQDTSRRIWPSSVARLPHVGLQSVDRRQQSQVRAGLTTPTKANHFGVRGGSGSSGNRHRYADTTVARDEPGTPTRSGIKPLAQFPRPPTASTSASKSKAFRGLQNSFADFGPVHEKIRQQRQSPAKATKPGTTLAPAEWDADQPMATGHADQENVLMADDHQSTPPTRAESAGQHDHRAEDIESVRAKQREHNYLAAVFEILSRRTLIVSLLLSHSSPKAAAPTLYPANRFNPTGSRPHPRPSHVSYDTAPSSSTLSRLISANLVADCPDLLVYRYRRAVESLLSNLSRAKALEPMEREDAFQLLSADDKDQAIEELDFSSATMQLSHAIATSLMLMAGVLLRLCQTDLLVDVLRLVSCLVCVLPRFGMDLECLQTDQDVKRDEMEFLGNGEGEGEWDKYATPIHVLDILAQCIDGCQPPGAARDSGASSYAVNRESEGADILGAQRTRDNTDRLVLGDKTLSPEAQDDLLTSVVILLESMSQSSASNLTSHHHPLRLLSRPGLLHKFLHHSRSPFILSSTVRLLASAVSNSALIHECLASKADNSNNSSVRRGNAKFPILELLVKHLVDRRFDLAESEWHPLHCGILTFLTQAALRSADTLLVLADSAALLAALIRCLSLDSDFVWLQSRPTFFLPARLPTFRKRSNKLVSSHSTGLDMLAGNMVNATERIVVDTRLLNLLYNYPLPLASGSVHHFESGGGLQEERMANISLATKLDQPETYSMLNGIRQSFIVALSRIAYCSEPDWIRTERKLLANLLPEFRQRSEQNVCQSNEVGTQELNKMQEDLKEVVEEVEKEIQRLDRVSMLLEAIADVAGDLTDLVLSPEEVDAVYDLLGSEEDEDELEIDEKYVQREKEGQEQAMDVDMEELNRQEQQEEEEEEEEEMVPNTPLQVGSEEESEPELHTSRRKSKSLSRTTSIKTGSKSVSPRKAQAIDGSGNAGDGGDGEGGESIVDVIEIDDSD
ncbi:uncharacterized protein MEPE_02348 [Melanopsichium pennsylvanicum]|uniref:Uncharacterized protein n=2 Tax=Melanopsichium pennsylvanicum TaxID=63383 RepID=A0AAJ5C4F6_9BASI|nr:conserved hypothetical protein [Melanopsichium pennsylvanicum 4]SNX83641.1 uncharacterized protein MEPE_02348 [Melanopsichium pennsylvanicum]